ncbi:MAG: Phage-related protein [Microgenomates group bacterium GW2011_GWA2_40_6]|nr:MAG: Phage-related protein [Microgenomates group bacterium GW2011_GWA2_40_6]
MTSIRYFIRGGDNPVRDFLNENPKIKTKAFRIFENIEEFGLVSAIPHIKKLSGQPLWEIRILGQDSARIIYATKVKSEITLLHAFKKKSKKTPPKEIRTALDRLKLTS